GQFLCETFGLVAPGMPQTAARIGLNYTLVAIGNEPAQTTQLFTTMIATAFFENDINKILDAGIASLDKNSRTLQVVNDVRRWHNQYPDDWRETRRLIRDKYTQEDGESLRDRNGFELNTAAIIASLFYGQDDFQETLKHSFNFGWDADNNAAQVGTILGVIYGYRKMMNHNDRYNPQWLIVDRYKNTTREGMPMDETITSFSDRIVEVFEMVNESNGGSRTVVDNTLVYRIPIEQPAPVIKVVSFEEQRQNLKNKWEQQIIEGLSSDNRKERARAAYLAVCLDMNTDLARNHRRQWRQASHDLSGYWKVMNNIFYGGNHQNHIIDFQNIIEFREKFERAGFKAPARGANSSEIFRDMEYWRDPEDLY
ncbi:MAG TPA: ADP-ribosylglycohydrolase family protein, partial [Bacteroidales bacterium]|nr:ADP-ribosylglycohydrolase family protein [Bacteroidales bacterium]